MQTPHHSPAGPVEPFTLPHAEAFDMSSKAGADFRISVGVPVSYGSSERTYPVLYVLDADLVFTTILEISRLRGSAGEIGEIIVVGIGYPLGTDFLTLHTRRPYDFSTAEWDAPTPFLQYLEGFFTSLGLPLRLGGAPHLLDFITEELQPLIAERYPVDASDQGLFGASAAGNFVGHALFTRPQAFTKYIAASPAFAYNNGGVIQLEADYAKNHDDLPVTLHLGAGSEETLDLAGGSIVSGVVGIAETLQGRAYPNLRLTCDLLTGKGHITAGTEIIQRGLEICWPGTRYELSAEGTAELFRGATGQADATTA